MNDDFDPSNKSSIHLSCMQVDCRHQVAVLLTFSILLPSCTAEK